MLTKIWNFIRPIKWLLLILLLLLGGYVGIKVVLPTYNRVSSESSPIVKIEATNDKEYTRSDTIKPEDFTVMATHKNGKRLQIEPEDFTVSRKKVNRVGKTTAVTVRLKNDESVTYDVYVKNHRDAILRFNCGATNLQDVKAVLYDNGELCFEGTGDVLQFNDYPWLDYDGADDNPIESITFSDGVTPSDMDNWFSGLSTLSYVGKLPSSVQSLSGTFSGCSLEKGADWSSCTGLLNTTDTYNGCSLLTEIPALPASVRIADGMCTDCPELLEAADLTKATSLTSAQSTFAGCSKLIKASMAPKVVYINNMYQNCINLKETPDIPSSVVSMDSTFSGDISLVTIHTIPANVQYMNSTFEGAKRIEGNATIQATPVEFNSCFSNAAIATKINLSGKSKNLNLIADTAQSRNVLVNGKAPVVE